MLGGMEIERLGEVIDNYSFTLGCFTNCHQMTGGKRNLRFASERFLLVALVEMTNYTDVGSANPSGNSGLIWYSAMRSQNFR